MAKKPTYKEAKLQEQEQIKQSLLTTAENLAERLGIDKKLVYFCDATNKRSACARVRLTEDVDLTVTADDGYLYYRSVKYTLSFVTNESEAIIGPARDLMRAVQLEEKLEQLTKEIEELKTDKVDINYD